MTEPLLLLGFFSVVLLAVTAAGLVLLRAAPEAAGAPARDERQGGGESETSAHFLLGRALLLMGEAVPASRAATNPVRRLLISAGYRHPTALAMFYGVKSSAAISLAVLAGWSASQPWDSVLVAALAGAALGWWVPDRALRSLVRQRSRRLRAALPAALDLLVLGLESGQSLDASIFNTGHELRHAHKDLSDELALVYLELLAGRTRAEALRLFADRSNEPEVTKLVATLIDSDRFGTSLAQDLRNHGRYLRTRMRHSAQEQARKLAVKLVFPVFFLIFPIVLLVTLGPAVMQLQQQLGSFLK